MNLITLYSVSYTFCLTGNVETKMAFVTTTKKKPLILQLFKNITFELMQLLVHFKEQAKIHYYILFPIEQIKHEYL